MAREHRIKDIDGKMTIRPFTPEEELAADQREAEIAARNTMEARVERAFPQTDAGKAIFNAFFNQENRIRVLEGKPAITKAQLKKWFESQIT